MVAQERAMNMITNNMANMNTPGFKADRVLFESYLKRSSEAGAEIPSGEDISAGYLPEKQNDNTYLITSEAYTDYSQGGMRETSNPLDIALEGDGFLAVMTDAGERYIRGGSFVFGPDGEIQTAEGHDLLNQDGNPIFLDGKSFYLKDDGTITGMNNEDIDRLRVVTFADKSVLKKEGSSLFVADDTEFAVTSDATVKQGYVEGSNINPVAEMARMITALRHYNLFQKSIQSHDEMTSKLINDVGK
jgi:flagellar basal-body rod protein FlgG